LFLRLTLRLAPVWAVSFSVWSPWLGAAGERTAHACSCAQPALRVVPRPNDRAPRNTHVWVEVPPGLAEAAVTLRGVEVGPVDQRRYGSGGVRVIEIIPRRPLAARSRYQVLVAGELAGELVTGDQIDEAPPTWDGLQSGAVSAGVVAGCGAGEPFVTLGLGRRDDDTTPAPALRYAIWVGGAGKPIDYERPPTTVVSSWGDRLSLGHESRCSPPNLELPGTLAVGVRVVDLAGNASPPSEADINVSAATTAPPPSQSPPQR
jgi:hypothetical protein